MLVGSDRSTCCLERIMGSRQTAAKSEKEQGNDLRPSVTHVCTGLMDDQEMRCGLSRYKSPLVRVPRSYRDNPGSPYWQSLPG